MGWIDLHTNRSHKLWRVDICTSSCITLNSQHSLPVSFVCRPPVVDSAKPDAGFRERPVRLPGLRPQRGVGRLAEHLLQLLVGLRRHHRRVRRRDKAVGGGRGLLLHHIPWRAHARECVCLLCVRVCVCACCVCVHVCTLSCPFLVCVVLAHEHVGGFREFAFFFFGADNGGYSWSWIHGSTEDGKDHPNDRRADGLT